jgi:hypothetical protein
LPPTIQRTARACDARVARLRMRGEAISRCITSSKQSGASNFLPVPLWPVTDCIRDHIAYLLFVGDVVFDKLSIALILGILKRSGQFLDLTLAFVELGALSLPVGLFLLGHRTFDDNLAALHVDYDVVGMECTSSLGNFVPPSAPKPITSARCRTRPILFAPVSFPRLSANS